MASIARGFSDWRIEAGIFKDAGVHPKANNGETYAELAHINEFGGGNIPERPAFRTSFFNNRRKYSRKLREITRRGLQGNTLRRSSFDTLGREAVRDIESSITGGNWRRNADSTQLAKGGGHQMINAPLIGIEDGHVHTLNKLDYKVKR